MAKNLSELPARTATSDADLIHVNTGGANNDYKQTKANFLKDVRARSFTEFATDSTLTSQIDALGAGAWSGRIASYGHKSETGVPVNASFLVDAIVYGTNNAYVEITTAAAIAYTFFNNKNGGAWSGWQLKDYPNGAFSVLGDIMSSATDAMKARGFAGVSIQDGLARIDFTCKITTAGTDSSNYNWGLDLSVFRNSTALLSGLTFMSSGNWTAYKSDTYAPLIGSMGYATRLTATETHAVPARLYDASGTNFGAWASSYFSLGTYFSGHVYGKIIL